MVYTYIYKGVYKQISYINQEIGNFSLVNYKFLDFNKQLAKTNDNNKNYYYLFFSKTILSLSSFLSMSPLLVCTLSTLLFLFPE